MTGHWKSPILFETFGGSRAEAFRAGIELGGRGQAVHAIADGEVVFVHREGDPSSLPRGGGSLMVVQHEGGVQSVYSHLDQVNGGLTDVRSRALGGALGTVGDTGAVQGPRLSLLIIDAEESRFLNPIKLDTPPLTPILSFDDTPPPVVDQVFLVQAGRRVALEESTIVGTGDGEILVVAYDTVSHGSYGQRVTPYRLSISSSGQLITEVTFDSLTERDGRLVLSGGGQSHSTLYADTWTYRLGRLSFPEGRTHVQVRVDGFAGGSTIRDYYLEAKP